MNERVDQGTVRRRRGPTVGDLLRSLLPLVALILVAVWLYTPGRADPVHEIDAGPEFSRAAALADFPVLVPQALATGWQPTSAVVDPAVQGGPVGLDVGYVTPEREFARLVQSSLPEQIVLTNVLGTGYVETGPTSIAGRAWRRLRAANGEDALIRTDAGATVVVTGSATLEELRSLAGSLEPARD